MLQNPQWLLVPQDVSTSQPGLQALCELITPPSSHRCFGHMGTPYLGHSEPALREPFAPVVLAPISKASETAVPLGLPWLFRILAPAWPG